MMTMMTIMMMFSVCSEYRAAAHVINDFGTCSDHGKLTFVMLFRPHYHNRCGSFTQTVRGSS